MYFNIPYIYTFPGTNIHWTTFLFIVIEGLIFSYQAIYWLSRPGDKTRFWYMVLVLLMVMYNIVGGLFVDASINIPINTQLYIEVFFAILVSMYFPFYVYYSLKIQELKFFAIKGSILFLFIPYIVSFVILNEFKGNVKISLAALIVSIIAYSSFYLYKLYRILIFKILKDKSLDKYFKERLIGVTITITLWVSCFYCFALFNLNQYQEHIVTNTGFLIMSYIFIRQSVLESRGEYLKLLKSEQELQNINDILIQKVSERTQELEVAVEQKTNAIISLAHEIRTPLTLVNNCLDEYIDIYGKNDKINLVKENVDVLNNYVETFFNEEKFRKGLSFYKHDQIVNFSEFVTYKIASFKAYASKKQMIITEHIEENITIKADPEALHRILNNLLENAIKFTNENGLVNVTLQLNENIVLLTVKDSGKGIPENMLGRIFDPYFQVPQENKYTQGMGMGLSIVNNCILSLGGKIYVKSIENKGSEFIIELERHLLKGNERLSDYSKDEELRTLSNKTIADAISDSTLASILIVEDNYEMLRYLRDKLKNYYNIYVAENGKVALIKLKEIPKPSLIISDVMMDEIDGFAFFNTIAGIPAYNHIPFIFLTAKTTTSDKMHGLSLGAVDYIQKPFSINELIKKTESIIGSAKKQKEAILNSALEYITGNLEAQKTETNLSKEVFDNNCKIYSITQREKEVIQYLADNFTIKEVSVKLFLSERTVQKHCENIFSKVNVKSKLELIKKIYS